MFPLTGNSKKRGFLERAYLDAWAVVFGRAVEERRQFQPPDISFSLQTSADWKTPIISQV